MEEKWFERTLIVLGVIGVAVLLFASVANAAGTVCQIGNGCTGTSTAPTFGQVLVGNSIGTYNLTATSSLGFPVGGSGTVTSIVAGTGLSGGTITTSGTISLNIANANWWTARQNFTNATSSEFEATSTVWLDNTKSALLLTDSNGKVGTYAGSSGACTNQFPTSLTALGVEGGCTSVTDAFFSGQLSLSHGGTNASLSGASQLVAVNSGNTALTTNSGYTLTSSLLTAPNASTTNLTAGSSNYTVNPLNEFPIYIASSTWGTGTTTITLTNNIRALTWVDAQCDTSAGSLEVRLYTGTGAGTTILYWSASTTRGTLTFSSNNALSVSTTTFMDIGNAASSPTSFNCTPEYTYNSSS